jgi:hypothetical protein
MRPMTWNKALAVALAVAGGCAWLLLVGWRLTEVPGMHMDEAWTILAADYEWTPANPFSGLSPYSGPFPRLLLAAFPFADGLAVLRVASVVCNGIALVLLGLIFRRVYPQVAQYAWSLVLVATTPAWLAGLRLGFEVAMFTPLFAVLGLYLLMRQTPWAAFGAGLSWGLGMYNHPIGACFPLSVAVAWLVVHRRRPPVALVPLAGGLFAGLAPRFVALALYGSQRDLGFGVDYSFPAALRDLRSLPAELWETLHGRTVFLRYVGQVAVNVWPYWLLALLLLVPWVRAPRAFPRPALMALVVALSHAVFSTLEAPYIEVRFLLLALIGVGCFVALLGAGAVARDARWRALVYPVGASLALFQLFYMFCNYYRPWQRNELVSGQFWMGERSPGLRSDNFFPRTELVRHLRSISPPPEQIIATPSSVSLALSVLLGDTDIRVTDPGNCDRARRTVWVGYHSGEAPKTYCADTHVGNMCFRKPVLVDRYYIVAGPKWR